MSIYMPCRYGGDPHIAKYWYVRSTPNPTKKTVMFGSRSKAVGHSAALVGALGHKKEVNGGGAANE